MEPKSSSSNRLNLLWYTFVSCKPIVYELLYHIQRGNFLYQIFLGMVFRLAFIPCLVEAATVAIASHFLLDLPWLWGFMLGFVLAAVSPGML
jgi:NhaP-type Na+/H+ or K+/H+ antiporter